MIIDPPSVFAPVSDWIEFRKSMEALVSAEPNNEDAVEALKLARGEEARLTS